MTTTRTAQGLVEGTDRAGILDVDGLTRDGDAVPLLRGGAWQI